MRPLVVVQSSPRWDAAYAMAWAARGAGYDLVGVQAHEEDASLPDVDPSRAVFLYGSIGLVRMAGRSPPLRRWVHAEPDRFDPALWAEALGVDFVNASGEAMTAEAFARLADDRPRHVRPARPDKRPPGGVVSPSALARMSLPPDTPLWASPLTSITDEARVFVVHGRPVVASGYRAEGRYAVWTDPARTRPVLAAAARLGERFLPHPCCVMDLGRSEGRWRLIEFNTIHSSGLYGIDPAEVLASYFAA